LEQAAKNNIKVKVSLSGPQDKIKKINNKSTLKTTFTNSNSRLYISDRKVFYSQRRKLILRLEII